jgi:hypothetical protein
LLLSLWFDCVIPPTRQTLLHAVSFVISETGLAKMVVRIWAIAICSMFQMGLLISKFHSAHANWDKYLRNAARVF